MITAERLRGVYDKEKVSAIYNEVRAEKGFAGFCRQFLYDEDALVTRNALWVLTKATNAEISQLQPMRDELIDVVLTTENSSVRRLSLNIIERLKMTKEELRADFLDFCLERMTAIKEYPGIQSLCMKLAFRICKFYPELTDEFRRTLDAMETSYYKPAVRSVRSRILNGKIK
ncbi:MAG: hypothetical protein K2O17_01620 [Bacteroidaceae bacterium]|nr:hypothetical protein [Bacteroidaceae bacterium]